MRVADIMTTQVITVSPETTLKEVAGLLAARGISGAPVVDSERHVVGVVSEADILAKERRPRRRSRFERFLGYGNASDPKATARVAGEAMTSPAVTIGAERRVDAAAALMLDRSVNRLPVLDRDGVLVGIVTRADLVRAFVVTDDQIEREIREEVILHELWLDPTDFELEVDHGEVSVTGRVQSESESDLLVRRIRLVPGVVSVALHDVARR